MHFPYIESQKRSEGKLKSLEEKSNITEAKAKKSVRALVTKAMSGSQLRDMFGSQGAPEILQSGLEC